MPTLSILIPMYNAAATLERTLRSLLCIAPEHRGEVQVIVVNDGSQDNSLAIAQAFAEQHADFHWKLIDQPNAGVSAARNAGLRLAAGEWIMFLDADDELALDPLAISNRDRDSTSLLFSYVLCSHRRRRRIVRPPRITDANFCYHFTSRCPVAISSVVFRADQLDHLFSTDVACTEDWLFWNLNSKLFTRPSLFPSSILVNVHLHAGNTSRQYCNWGRGRKTSAERLIEHYGASTRLVVRNNLLLQRDIGTLQQGQMIALTATTRLPCSPLLYAKFWIYLLAFWSGYRATYYR